MELATLCGKTLSRAGRPFTGHSLAQHQKDCEKCQAIDRLNATVTAVMAFAPFPLTQDIGADLPDGAFWAMASELREEYY